MTSVAEECDVLIAGGGLVGCALACALARLPLSIVLVEGRDPRLAEQAHFDARVTALANGSQRILAALELWSELAPHAGAIRSIHVSERGRFGAARIAAREEGVEALGFTVENYRLSRALWARLGAAPGIRCLAPAAVRSLASEPGHMTVEVEVEGDRRSIRTRLLVGADGAESFVRHALGIAAARYTYGQCAVVVNCSTQAAHEGRAFERFLERGALAVLPLAGERVAVVWTLEADEAARVTGLDDPRFLAALQRAFGYRLGRILRAGRRGVHQLARVRSATVCAPRAVLIGSAAVNLHPVAGQGFNLALRDVAALAETLSDAVRDGDDPGAPTVLDRYRRWRAADQRRVAAFTHGLIRLFGYEAPALGFGRGLGLAAFDLLPGAKARLARRTMGLAGHAPRLARGLSL